MDASGDFDPKELIRRVEALGYHAESPDASADRKIRGHIRLTPWSINSTARLSWLPLFYIPNPAGIIRAHCCCSSPSRYHWFQTDPQILRIQTILQALAAIIAGYPIANRGVRALIFGRQITIDLLMAIATLGALLIGETGEAATVVMLFAIGEALEGYTAERARNSLRSLIALKPDVAHVMRPCMDCSEHMGQQGYNGGACPICGEHETTLPVEQVAIGELVIVKPGEQIPVDGHITSGSSFVNQAPVTGESIPVQKSPGDKVYAGTLNGDSVLEVTVSQLATNSTISRIVRLVEQAQTRRAPIERFIDRFAAWYTPAVVGLALLVAILPPLLSNTPFLDSNGTHGSLYRALTLLIIACPCALVISTPVTLVSALTSLAHQGVLVKGGVFLDVMARAHIFAFDKTGTLTLGQPSVTQARSVDCIPGTLRCAACDDMIALAGTLERRSDHPLAQAIMAEVETRQLYHTYPAAESIQAMAGMGVQGFSNGNRILVGSHDLFHTRDDLARPKTTC